MHRLSIGAFAWAVVLLAAWGTFGAEERVCTATLQADGRWALIPVDDAARMCQLEIFDGTTCVRRARVAYSAARPAWWASIDLEDHHGRRLDFRLKGLSTDAMDLTAVRFSPTPWRADDLYRESYRPQFHFSPKVGWLNDPNGMYYRNGTWHLFYQWYPYSARGVDKYWGHATSRDLVHWCEQDAPALYTDDTGMMYSGSAVVDRRNCSGLGMGAQILFYTAAGRVFTQRLAYSRDDIHFEKLPGEAILPNFAADNRDPKVFWHAPTQRWIMVVYGPDAGCHAVWFFSSSNLRDWSRESVFRGDELKKGRYLYECPGMEELPVEGGSGTRWVLWGANMQYAVGRFDGHRFVAEAERLRSYETPHWNRNSYYAEQTFSGAPDGRVIAIPWFEIGVEGRIRHAMGLPQELGLRQTASGPRLTRRPVRELEALREGPPREMKDVGCELAEIFISCRVAQGACAEFSLRGERLVYDDASHTLGLKGRADCRVPWTAPRGHLALHAFLDRVGLEVFSQDGLQCAPFPMVRPDPKTRNFVNCSSAQLVSERHFTVYSLKSCLPR